MSLASYRTALQLVEIGADRETVVMLCLMLCDEEDGAALAGVFPLTAEEVAARQATPDGRLADDPPDPEAGVT